MGLLERFKAGWLLFKNSLEIIMGHKKLLLFPLATSLLTMGLALFFLTPIALQPTGHAYTEAAHWSAIGASLGHMTKNETVHLQPQAYALAVVFYFISMFLATFFNVAFYSEIFKALKGEPVSISEGLRFAATRAKPIFYWSLFAGLVGLILKALEERFGFFGRQVIRYIGLAWAVAAVFAIPVIIREPEAVSPVDVVRRSAGTIKKAWGEALAGYAGLQIGGFLIVMGSLGLIGSALLVSFQTGDWVILGLALPVWVIGLFAFSYVLGVANNVYCCVLYSYAAEGVLPPGYSAELMALGWKQKKD